MRYYHFFIFLILLICFQISHADSTLVFIEKGGRFSKPVNLDSKFKFYAFIKKDSNHFCFKLIAIKWELKPDSSYANGLFQKSGYEIEGDYADNFIVASNYSLDSSFYLYGKYFYARSEILYPGNHYEFYKYVFRLRYYDSHPITLYSFGNVSDKKSKIELRLGDEVIEKNIENTIPVLVFEGNFNNDNKKPDFILKIDKEYYAFLSQKNGYQKIKFQYFHGDRTPEF